MHLPASTGDVAHFLGITEPRLNDLIRRGRIVPLPPIAAGRRLWHREHIAQAAEHLGRPTDELGNLLSAGEGCTVGDTTPELSTEDPRP